MVLNIKENLPVNMQDLDRKEKNKVIKLILKKLLSIDKYCHSFNYLIIQRFINYNRLINELTYTNIRYV